MKYKKSIKKEIHYNYECINCGNEFSRRNRISINECYDCHAFNTLIEKRIEKEQEYIEQFCPICENFFHTSNFLNTNIKAEHVLWLANMVMHYRHNHITSWNKEWSRHGYNTKHFNEDVYSTEKAKVNERAKRQILRKCTDYMQKNGFTVEHVKQLQNTDDKTILLYEKLLTQTK